jgi:hypothetical protein
MKFGALIATAMAVLPSLGSAYEVGCVYPPGMPDPFEARYHLHSYSGSYFMAEKFETPIAIHLAALSSVCQANCLAYQDDKVLNVLTKERPVVTVPPEYHNAWSRMLCIAQCFSILSDEAGRPGFYDVFYDKWGLEVEKRRDVIGLGFIAAQGGDASGLQAILEEEDHHPFTVGQIVASELLLYVINDGTNALGTWTYDSETGQPVKCTANCAFYQDTTGYFPRNHPTGKALNGTEKYVVEGNDKHWAPLIDTKQTGYFTAQQHITPHFGFTAKTKLYASVDDFPSCPDPAYDYYQESLDLIEVMKETSSNPIKKQKIPFYDNKLMMINTIESFVRDTHPDSYSFEDELLYIESMSAAEYESMLMAWRQKIVYDLARPTTIIKRWGSDILNTFSGNKTQDGPSEIAARDFQSFQRTMPHAEYPSGSSCICTAYAEATDAFTMTYFNDTVKNMPVGGAGDGTGFGCDPTLDPALLVAVGCDWNFTVTDMAELISDCSQSRIWAGFHYPAAVIEGEKMCKGIGVKGAEWEKMIRNGSSFTTKYLKGDPRPTCSNPPPASATENDSAARTWNLIAASAVPLVAASLAM